ncbi:FkbM family methyltransferase [Hydrogenophaga sp. BPS33]|uniref:FkbM family methyltransferase n=1 Tax=Hydrogenophaga sp. BPS33 TaxID=2651974 RepID=UPI00135B906E|nr:FkbM family methyltransferase [Hydrogenophaga sp. BPS33]
MSVMRTVRRLIPAFLKRALKQRTLPYRVSELVSSALPEVVCVDVGASFYPHVKWLTLLNAPHTRWLAVEPNQENLAYLKAWSWPSQVSACTTGLSREGGTQTLYITNVDTGSSLLPPEIPASMTHRVPHLDYFFPVTERRIETITLMQAIEGLPANAPTFVKLDTQGTELSILQGAQPVFDARRIVGVEMESTMLAQPIMKGSGKFWQACEYMEAQGFELLHVKPIQATKSGRSKADLNTYLNECDAVFALRQDVTEMLAVEFRVALFAFYLTNLLFEEALSLLERDHQIKTFLQQRGARVGDLIALLRSSTR